MTFEEWWEREDRVYLNEYSTFKMVGAQAWNHQQKRTDELEECLEQALSDLKYWEDKATALEYDKIGC